MAKLILNGATSGSVTLESPAVSGTTTLTLPATSGTVITTGSTFGGTGPAFSAYASAATSLTGAASTKILFATEVFDTNSNFASSRFTPTVAGYYQINAGYQINSQDNQLYIFKNGSVIYQSAESVSYGQTVSGLVYCDGSTDYIEIYAYVTTTVNTVTGLQKTWFNGSMVRSA